MGSFFQTLISLLKSLVSFLLGQPASGSKAGTPLLASGGISPATTPKPVDPSRAWSPCAWCDGLMSPDDYSELPSGEAVHMSCLTKRFDEQTWLSVRRVMTGELRPVYLALGQTKEVQDIIFRLYPEKGVSSEDAFNVLRELELKVRGLKTPDFRTASAAIAAISQARIELRAFLARA